MQYAPIGLLSGGEQRRLYLLRVLMAAPNVLLLDEPTNDLDIQTLITLEEYLDNFAGCVIVVSHDRYFLDRTVEHIFRFESEGRLQQYPGNYTNFLEARELAAKAATPLKAKHTNTGKVQANQPQVNGQSLEKRKLSFKEQKELAALEVEIQEGERRQAEIEALLSNNPSDAQLVHQLYQERELLIVRLAGALDRWAELA
jgi:ATP-binding cassette subfamily F protein uup